MVIVSEGEGRNQRSPYKGITTLHLLFQHTSLQIIITKEARVRELSHQIKRSLIMRDFFSCL